MIDVSWLNQLTTVGATASLRMGGKIIGHFMDMSRLKREYKYKRWEGTIADQKSARKNQNTPMVIGRLFLTIFVTCSILGALVIAAFFGWDVNVETIHKSGFFAQLFSGPTVASWHTFTGFTIPSIAWFYISAIIGFYFGGRMTSTG